MPQNLQIEIYATCLFWTVTGCIVLIQFSCVLLFLFLSLSLPPPLSLSLSLSVIFPSPYLTSFCWSTYFYQRNVPFRYILGKTVQNKTTWIENNNYAVKFTFFGEGGCPPLIILHLLEATLQWFPLILTGPSDKSRFACNKSSVLGRLCCTYMHTCVYVCMCACTHVYE